MRIDLELRDMRADGVGQVLERRLEIELLLVIVTFDQPCQLLRVDLHLLGFEVMEQHQVRLQVAIAGQREPASIRTGLLDGDRHQQNRRSVITTIVRRRPACHPQRNEQRVEAPLFLVDDGALADLLELGRRGDAVGRIHEVRQFDGRRRRADQRGDRVLRARGQIEGSLPEFPEEKKIVPPAGIDQAVDPCSACAFDCRAPVLRNRSISPARRSLAEIQLPSPFSVLSCPARLVVLKPGLTGCHEERKANCPAAAARHEHKGIRHIT